MNWPAYRPYFPALVKLLQGEIYAEDEKHWTFVLQYREDIQNYFLKIGMLLVVVEHEEFAYLRSLQADEVPEGFAELPKLTRRRMLSFPVTVLCILLKKQYTQHQENVGSLEPPTIEMDDLFAAYQAIPAVSRVDEWRGRQHFEAQFKKVKTELRVVKEVSSEPPCFRILPSINRIVTAEFLDHVEAFRLGRDVTKAAEEISLE